MVKVVLDTNVIISAALSSDGNPGIIFEMLISGMIKNFTTQEIIDEVREVLERPRISELLLLKDKEFILSTYETLSEKIEPSITLNLVQSDPDDNKFIDCAVNAAVNYLISGDSHLLKLNDVQGIKIVSPTEFIQVMQQKRE